MPLEGTRVPLPSVVDVLERDCVTGAFQRQRPLSGSGAEHLTLAEQFAHAQDEIVLTSDELNALGDRQLEIRSGVLRDACARLFGLTLG